MEINKTQILLLTTFAIVAIIALVVVQVFPRQRAVSFIPTVQYKMVKIENAAAEWAQFEVPSTWSVFNNPESSGEHDRPQQPTGSIGQFDVSLSDTNWSQVDFYFIQDDVVDEFTREGKAAVPSAWSKEKVGGIEVDVVTQDLDNGKVTKDGTGGKVYFVPLEGTMKTLIIEKQALGDEEFEAGFIHILKTIQFIV